MKLKHTFFLMAFAGILFCTHGFCDTDSGSLHAESRSEASIQNLAVNNDFEEVFKNQPNFWSLDAWLMDPGYTNIYSEQDGAYSGEYYVTIENIKSNDSRLVQDIAVKPSTVYLLSCYVRVQGIPADKTGANVAVMKQGFSDVSAHSEDTNGKWQYIELAVKTCPDQTVMRVAIRLGFFGSDVAGKASFDRFRLEEVFNPANLSVRPVCKEAQGETKSEVSGLVIIAIVAGLLLIGIIAFVIFAFAAGKRPKAEGDKQVQADSPPEAGDTPRFLLAKDKPDFTKTDIILALGLTIVYAVIAFVNLGSNEAPETFWRPASRGENVTVDFGKEELVRRIYYWEGLPGGHSPNESKYEIEGSQDGVTWTHIALINPKTVCWWYFDTTSVLARYVRITVDVPSSWLNEVVFLGNDTEHPIKIERIIPGQRNAFTTGKVENLFDEYSDVGNAKAKKKLVLRPSIMTGMSPGFDEQYHGRTALEHLNYRHPYENTHPPLGKVLMAAGILVLGMNPFGWRFAGTLFGVLIVPLMFAFGKRLFKKTEYAFMAAFLMMFDFMHFTQSRIATIDTYPVFFVIASFYFMYRFCEMGYLKTEFNKMLLPLLLSGISWGLGAASKWTALYAFPGLAVIFFASLYKKWREVRDAKASKSLKKDKDEWDSIQAKIGKFQAHAWLLFGWSFIAFIIVPAILYSLSYVPILMSKEVNWNLKWIIDNQFGMYDYHAKVETYATHPSQTFWYQWPLMTKPMPYNYGEGLPEGQTQRLLAFGNPAVWWIGSLAAIVVALMAFITFLRRVHLETRETFRKRGVLLSGFLILIMLASLVIAVVYFLDQKNLKTALPDFKDYIAITGILSIVSFRFAVAIWEWKKWGMYGFAGASAVISFLTIAGGVLIHAIAVIIALVIAALLVIPAWRNMRKGNLMEKYGDMRDEIRLFIVIGLATLYFPWVISPRQLTFIYHFFPSVPFIIFCVIYLVKLLREKVLAPIIEKGESGKIYSILTNGFVCLYLFLVMLLFIMFYPIIAGMPAATDYIKGWLMWFQNNPIWQWNFA